MTKYRFNFFLLVIAMVVSITSCNRDEVMVEPPTVLAKSGVYVLSEGGFSPGTSKLSFFDFESEQFNANIFNPGSLGLFPDGILLNEGNLYITEQGNFGAPGKIYKITLKAWYFAHQFKAGTRLGIRVTNDLFPQYAKIPGTGESLFTATKYVRSKNTVYKSAKYPSRVRFWTFDF